MNHAVTCIKMSPFFCPIIEISNELNLYYEVTCLKRPHFLCHKDNLFIQVPTDDL